MAITYELTDPTTGLSANAFIIVPPKGDETAPPKIKSSLPPQIVEMGGSKTWKLSDIITVPSGRASKLSGASGVSATNSNGKSPYDDDQTITFTAAKGYRGPAAITFKVNDGHDAGQSKDRVTPLVLPLTIGSPDQSDVPPTFTPPDQQIQAGESPVTIDLRSSSFHPNPEVLSKLTYSGLSGASNEIEASLSGSKLTMSAPLGVQPGSAATLKFTVSSGKFTIAGSVNVEVVSSSRPIASQKAVQAKDIRRGNTATVSDATGSDYWVNPFPGKPLTITSAKLSNAPKGVTVTYTASSISVSASSGADIGVASVTYQVQDATKDAKRVATGQYNVTIHDVPAQPQPPTATASDAEATVTLSRAPADNGKPITGYRITGGPKTVTTTTLGSVRITGLTNGTAYKFAVEAENADGWSAKSSDSSPVTPYGTPGPVTGLTVSASGYSGSATVTASWSKLSDPSGTGGGTVTYSYKLDGGEWKTTSGTSGSFSNVGKGVHTVTVMATNDHSNKPNTPVKAQSPEIKDKPIPQPSASVVKGAHPPAGWGSCSTAWNFVGASYSDLPAGNYKLTPMVGGSQIGTDIITVYLSGSGTVSTHGCVGNPGGQSVQVRFDGPGATFYATTNNWNGLSMNSGVHP
jgi:hypothetical protein